MISSSVSRNSKGRRKVNPKDFLDGAAVFGALGSLLNILPHIAAFLAIVWTLIRIYEWARVRIFKHEKDFDV